MGYEAEGIQSRGRFVYDLEGNGLNIGGGVRDDDITEVHCAVFFDIDTRNYITFDSIRGFNGIVALVNSATMLVCHNQIDFDLPILGKFFSAVPSNSCVIIDTLVWSRSLYPDRIREGGHGLEAWGKRNGIPKPPIEDWTVFTPDMLDRCREDVRNNYMTLLKLLDEAKMYDCGAFLKTEQNIAKIISEQCRHGCYIDQPLLNDLLAKLDIKLQQLEDKITPFFYKLATNAKPLKKVRNASGEYTKEIKAHFGEQLDDPKFSIQACGEGHAFSRITWETVSLRSQPQMLRVLAGYDWEPIEFTKAGNPKITEESIKHCKGISEIAEDFKAFRRYASRRDIFSGIRDHIDPDGRVRAKVNPQATNTLRMIHSIIVNIPKYKKTEEFSEMYRAIFMASPGLVIVGCDAKGIENRMLANRVNDPELTKVVCEEGGDFHTFLWNTCLDFVDSRGNFKNVEYAFFYGGGDLKLGAMCDNITRVFPDDAIEMGYHHVKSGKNKGLWGRGKSKPLTLKQVEYTYNGTLIRKCIMDGVPNLGTFAEEIKEESKCGYLTSFDGRRTIMRVGYDHQVKTHTALNAQLQTDDSCLMKKAQELLYYWLVVEGIPAWFIITMHDEFQLETAPENAERVAELANLSIKRAGEIFNLNVPTEGDAKIGKHWGETH